MERKFKRGDVVRLKSESPDMTVEEYYEDHSIMSGLKKETSKVKCTYYDDEKEQKIVYHEQDALELVTKNDE